MFSRLSFKEFNSPNKKETPVRTRSFSRNVRVYQSQYNSTETTRSTQISNNKKPQYETNTLYMKEAKKIIDMAIKKFGTVRKFKNFKYKSEEIVDNGHIIPICRGYFDKIKFPHPNIEDGVKIEFRLSKLGNVKGRHRKTNDELHIIMLNQNILDTSMNTQNAIECICVHEIDTHLVRSWNEQNQIWNNSEEKISRKDLGLSLVESREGKKIEEGLATINDVLHSNTNSLFWTALRYYICCLLDEFSNYATFKKIKDYFQFDQRAHNTIRSVKKMHGKSQIYFEGCVEILRDLNNIDFDRLYSGKLTLEDCKILKENPDYDLKIPVKNNKLVLPYIYRTNKKKYIKLLKKMKKDNRL